MRSTHGVAVPQQDLANIVEALDAAGRARSYEACERGDAAFHRGIALACNNALVLALFDLVNTARMLTVWGTLKQRTTTDERRAEYHDQHRAIVDALKDRDPRTAEAAMASHPQCVSDALLRHH